jgi:hypothetical protein
MTREEFAGHYWRLCAGFRQEPTAERSEVVFDAMKGLSAGAWKVVVERALGGARMPDLERLLKIASEVKEGERKTSQKRVCECGGNLDLPRVPPFGVLFRDEPIEAESFDEAVFAMDRRDHPERWIVCLFRCCGSCGRLFVLPLETRTLRRQDGSLVRLEEGQLMEPQSVLPFEDWERAGQGGVCEAGVPF